MFNKIKSHMSWQPFATSTPLKPNLEKIGNNNLCQNEINNPSDMLIDVLLDNYHQVSGQSKQTLKQKSRRNAASIYFDVSSSSSSEDEAHSENKKKHELKINSVGSKKTKEIEKSKSLEENLIINQQNKLRNKSNNIDFLKEVDNESNRSQSDKNNSTSKKIKCKAAQKKLKPSLKAKERLCSLTSNKTNASIIIEEVKSNGENCFAKSKSMAENSANHCESEIKQTNIVSSSNSNMGKKSRGNNQACSVISDKLAPSSETVKQLVLENINNDLKIFNSPYGTDKKNHGAKKNVVNECKSSKIVNEIIPAKKMRIKKNKTVDKESIQGNDKNLSHQLFSHSLEQELLNSLDLTTKDSDENQQHLNSPKQINNKLISKSKSEMEQVKVKSANVNCSHNEKKLEDFKENYMDSKREIDKNWEVPLRDLADSKNKMKLCHFEKSTENLVVKTSEKCAIMRDNKDFSGNKYTNKMKKNAVRQRNLESSRAVKKKIDHNNSEQSEKNDMKKVCLDKLAFKSITGNKFNNEDNKTNSDSIADPMKASDSLNPPVSVFKQLSSISSFEEFQSGCFTKECWSLKNFKCGILRLKPNSQHFSKTMRENSYVGGVVIKGAIKMKISEKKLELKEGDMAFVPPLTEWMAANEHVSESVMYYWCGKFKSL